MAYRFLLALAPALVLLVSLLGFVDEAAARDRLDGLLAFANPLLPPAILDAIREGGHSLLGKRSAEFLSVGILGTVWGASAGVQSLMKGIGRAYDVTVPRSAVRRTTIALGSTLAAPLVLSALVLATGILGAPAVPAAAIIVLLAISVLYHRIPGTGHRWRDGLPGSVFATAGLFALANVFGLIAASAAPQGALFGFGAAFALLLWMHAASFVLLCGAEINALRGREKGASLPRA